MYRFWKGKVRETKSSIFWDITPCSPLKVYRSFGVTCLIHLQMNNKISKKPGDFQRNTRCYPKITIDERSSNPTYGGEAVDNKMKAKSNVQETAYSLGKWLKVKRNETVSWENERKRKTQTERNERNREKIWTWKITLKACIFVPLS
jgi:hypothetical protein